jgi:hypothetical protein
MNKLTIITTSFRANHLIEINKSIIFDYIDEWIIVHDGNKIEYNTSNLLKLFDNIVMIKYTLSTSELDHLVIIYQLVVLTCIC